MAEKLGLMGLADLFSGAMKDRLNEKEAEGWEGWDNRKDMQVFEGGLERRIIRNILDGHWVDVANLAMFAWNFER